MTSVDGLVKIWSSLDVSRYYPLTLTTFWVQRRFWGLDPLPYHVVNIVLHALNAILVYLVLRHSQIRAAWVAAAVWAIHPVNVESVAWVTELKNVQSGFFFFLALLGFMESERSGSRGWYWLSIACGAAAVLSKPSTVILPLVLLMCAWWQRSQVTLRDWRRALPFFLMALPMAILTIVEQRGHVERSPQQVWSSSLLDRIAVAGQALWFYARTLFWPTNLSFIYPRWTGGRSVVSWVAWSGIAAVAAIGWRWRQTSWARAGLFGLGYFGVALLPVLGFFDVYFFRFSFVADHFQYLASIGLIALATAGIAAIVHRLPSRVAIAIAALISLAALSRQRMLIFADEETLWRDTVARNPRAVIAQNNLGLVLYGQLQYRQAMEHFARALDTDPDYSETHYNLGLVLTELGHYSEAETRMRRALELAPHFAKAENGLGYILLQRQQLEEAVPHFRRALEIDPSYVEAYNNLGTTWLNLGRVQQAELPFRQAIQCRPTDSAAHKNLGLVLLKQGQLDQAAQEFEIAARLNPADPEPHKYLADIFAAQNKPEETQREQARAAAAAERLGETHYRIAAALEDDGDLDGAIKHFRKSISFRPTSGDAYRALAKVLSEQNRCAEAVDTLRSGAEALPDDALVRDDLARLIAACSDVNKQKAAQ